MPRLSTSTPLLLLIITLLCIPSILARPVSFTALPQSNPITIALANGNYINGNNAPQNGGQDTSGDTTTKVTSGGSSTTTSNGNAAAVNPAPVIATDGNTNDEVNSLSQGGYSGNNIVDSLKSDGRLSP